MNATMSLLKQSKEKEPKKASWWVRSRRKLFIKDVLEVLRLYGMEAVWVHSHFINGETKRPKQATFYVSFAAAIHEELFCIEAEMDKHFRRRKVNLIDIATLQQNIKEFVFKDLERVL